MQERVKESKLYIILLLLFAMMTGCGKNSDGEFAASVSLTGGSGKAAIESPCRVIVKDGKTIADIVWSSPYYDYMIVDGKTYYPINEEGNSEFVIPIEPGIEMDIQADTVAMSEPHLIDYKVRFSLIEDETGKTSPDTVDELNEDEEADSGEPYGDIANPPAIPGLEVIATEQNQYAKGFCIHHYEEEYDVISVDDGRNYLIVPEGKDLPEGIDNDFICLRRPLDRIYLAASAVMCQFDAINAVNTIRLSGTKKEDWYIESASTAMEKGDMTYGGKYSAPDYEQIVAGEINLAVESTMILHVPKVQEKLEKLGIPVFIDRSSYEEEPLGRCEWIKVYGVLAGREDEAADSFNLQEKLVNELPDREKSGTTLTFFSINSGHSIVTRKKNDYFAKMVEIAGGEYLALTDDESGAFQVTISTEAFYDYASNADIMIYNGTIEDVPDSLLGMEKIDATFADFKAFQNGDVWYTDQSIYQNTNKIGTIINDLYGIISGTQEDTTFFHKLK